jgi:hypothetical protein
MADCVAYADADAVTDMTDIASSVALDRSMRIPKVGIYLLSVAAFGAGAMVERATSNLRFDGWKGAFVRRTEELA